MYYKSKLYISGLNLDPWMEGDLKAHMTAVLERLDLAGGLTFSPK